MFDLVCTECGETIGSISKELEASATIICVVCKNDEPVEEEEDEDEVCDEDEVTEEKGA